MKINMWPKWLYKRHATAPTPVSGVATWRTWGWHTWHVSGDKRGNQVPLLIVPSDHYDHHHCYYTWHGTVHTAQCGTTTRTTNTQASQLQSSSQWGNFFMKASCHQGGIKPNIFMLVVGGCFCAVRNCWMCFPLLWKQGFWRSVSM